MFPTFFHLCSFAVILWGDQNKIHGCRENIVGAKTTTVYVLEGHHVTMKAVVKNKGKSDTIVRWIGRKGLAKVTEKELRNQLVSHRVDIDDDKGHIILKAVDRKLNGTQYRYVEYQNEHIISQSAWALLVIGSMWIFVTASDHSIGFSYELFFFGRCAGGGSYISPLDQEIECHRRRIASSNMLFSLRDTLSQHLSVSVHSIKT